MKKSLISALLLIAMFNIATAQTTTTSSPASAPSAATSSKMMMPYYGDSDKTYSFDQQAAINLLTQKSTLLKINCNSAAVLKNLGLGSSKSTITSIGLDENDMSYSFDFTNCSLRGNKKDVQWSNKDITEDRGMMTAKNFLKSSKLKNRVFSPL